jgi:hypothetical protein
MSTEDKNELAREAMEDYMERDDGADAWLNVMAEIREEFEEQTNICRS